MTRPKSLYLPCVMLLTDLTVHHAAGTERQIKPDTRLHHPAVKAERQQLQDTLTTYDRTWIIEPVRPDQYTDQGGGPQRKQTTIKPGTRSITSPGLKTAYGLHSNCVVTWPDIEAPHTPMLH